MIDTAIKHMIEFIEKPSAVLANMPVCPFAKKARLGGKLRFEVLEFYSAGDVMPLIQTMGRQHELMQILHPGKIECSMLYDISGELNLKLPEFGLQAFCGHPEDQFNIAGLYTRREPFPTLQVIWMDVAKKAEERLSQKYYQNWKSENFVYTNLLPDHSSSSQSTG